MMYDQIVAKLTAVFSPAFLQVTNESHQHNVPAGSESHFKVVIACAQFEGQRLLTRHRAVNTVLADELANHIHALALHTYTLEEWQKAAENVPQSPACRGGSLADRAEKS
ncbi:MAG: transcriptional regulator BolA [Plesiomonas sp.]|uniref:transcriptional regulator BolA n=1 Tax=Plesiomonas sp. TaxID=2486279 RepID=UPI003F2BBA17